MNRTSLLALLCLVAVPGAALAQGKALKDKEAVTFNEVERGFYVGATAGWWFLVNAPTSGGNGPFSAGQAAQVELGMDIGERLSLGLFVMGANNRADSAYLGKAKVPGSASGDFSSITPGAVVRVMALGIADSQDVKRTWLYVRAGAGFMIFSPSTLLPDPDVMIFVGPGVEYYTRLRHFSIGIEVTGAFLLTSASVGFTITPNLRYAF
jgi:hypothetical protein